MWNMQVICSIMQGSLSVYAGQEETIYWHEMVNIINHDWLVIKPVDIYSYS